MSAKGIERQHHTNSSWWWCYVNHCYQNMAGTLTISIGATSLLKPKVLLRPGPASTPVASYGFLPFEAAVFLLRL